MRLRGYVITMLMVSSLAPHAMAQSNLDAATNEQYQPRLGDIMNAVQLRHMKLWFAGKALNWELAAYELRQINAGLGEAATLIRAFSLAILRPWQIRCGRLPMRSRPRTLAGSPGRSPT
jgi:hypothetical protein